MPREKPIPKEKEKTKWEKFAAKKGIKASRKDGKKIWDEEMGEWRDKYGFGARVLKRNPGEVERDWVQEVDEKKDAAKKEEGEKKGHGGKRKGEFFLSSCSVWRVEDSERYVGDANMRCVIGMGDNANRDRKLSKKSRK